jgi:hypothetical protein
VSGVPSSAVDVVLRSCTSVHCQRALQRKSHGSIVATLNSQENGDLFDRMDCLPDYPDLIRMRIYDSSICALNLFTLVETSLILSETLSLTPLPAGHESSKKTIPEGFEPPAPKFSPLRCVTGVRRRRRRHLIHWRRRSRRRWPHTTPLMLIIMDTQKGATLALAAGPAAGSSGRSLIGIGTQTRAERKRSLVMPHPNR